MSTELRHYHLQSKRVPSAQHRRFLRVVGVDRLPMTAVVLHNHAPVPYLSLVIVNARPAGLREDDASSIAGISALDAVVDLPTNITVAPDGDPLSDLVRNATHVQFAQRVTVAQLAMLGFTAPALNAVRITGRLVSLDAVGPLRLGLAFSRDHTGSPESMHILVDREPPIDNDPRQWCYALLSDAQRLCEEAELRELEVARRNALDAAVPPRPAVPVDFAAIQPPVPQFYAVPGGPGPVVDGPAPAPRVHWAIAAAANPAPAHPGPAPFLPPALPPVPPIPAPGMAIPPVPIPVAPVSGVPLIFLLCL